MTELRTFARFDRTLDAWVEFQGVPTSVVCEELKVLTFNVAASEEYFEDSCHSLISQLERVSAHLIALQEVTPAFLGSLLSSEWIKRSYFVSDSDCSTVFPSGCVLLSKFPLTDLQLSRLTRNGTGCMVSSKIRLNGRSMSLATLQLDSQGERSPHRSSSLRPALNVLIEDEHGLLLGDFGAQSYLFDMEEFLPENCVDPWIALQGVGKGYTLDPKVNKMEFESGVSLKRLRQSRILLRSHNQMWSPSEVWLLGTEPISSSLPHVFPSRHFGVVAVFQWCAVPALVVHSRD